MTSATPDRLGVILHELRSPVAALGALAEAARARLDPEQRLRVVTLAIAAARDVTRIVSDPDLISLRVECVDVAALASGLSGRTITVKVHGSPAADGDPTRLRQALANLVANGLRHGTHVVVDVTEDNGQVVLEVSDDGPGVAAELDPFARGSSTAGSTGYGLWLSRAIAEAHGGSLELVRDGRPGGRFRLALPSASVGR